MESRPFGFCGLDCDMCPIFIATEKNDNAFKKKIANEWPPILELYTNKGQSIEDIICYGCNSDGEVFLGCQDCQIRNCYRRKNLASCAACDDFDKCQMILDFFKKYPAAKENLMNR